MAGRAAILPILAVRLSVGPQAPWWQESDNLATLMFRPNLVDHLVFRVSDMDRTTRFYSALLGEPYREDDYVMFSAGATLLFFTQAAAKTRAYDKEQVGLNHIALGVRTIDELRIVESQLNKAAIAHSGINVWQDGSTRYIWLDDPDGIRVEYWLRPAEPS